MMVCYGSSVTHGAAVLVCGFVYQELKKELKELYI